MSNKSAGRDRGKVAAIAFLLAFSGAIVLSGLFFSIYSFIANTTFRVFNSDIPGVIFGVTVVYLGVRYFISVLKFKKELFKTSSKFTWRNFRRQGKKACN